MKAIAKQLLPPVLYNVLAGAKAKRSAGIFSSYQQALARCSKPGYEDTDLLDVVVEKTRRFAGQVSTGIIPIWEVPAYSLVSVMPLLGKKAGSTIKVLDLGGAAGAHYFHLRSTIGPGQRFEWVVVETPGMASRAKVLENDELRFTSSLEAAFEMLPEADLLHTSGTLQCVEDPAGLLQVLLNRRVEWMFFSRLGLNELDRTAITIHHSRLSDNGIGPLPEDFTDKWLSYPFTFMPEKQFLQAVQKSYHLVAKFQDKSGMFPVRGEKITGYGLLCRLKK